MAKVIGPLHSSEARGRMGGLVYNTWRGVATVKAKVAPCQPRTSLQLSIRAIAINLVRAWAHNAHQADWNAYAYAHPTTDGMGNSVRATGANWYLALGTRLKLISESVSETPPAVAAPNAVTGLALTPTVGQISAAWTTPATDTDSIEFWLDGPHSAGRAGSITKARCKSRPAANTTPEAFTGLQPGTYDVFARSLNRTTGLVSTYVSVSCVVPAA